MKNQIQLTKNQSFDSAQMIVDAHKLSRPSFVFFYKTILNTQRDNSTQRGRMLSDLYDELRAKILREEVEVDDSLQPSNLKKYLVDRGINSDLLNESMTDITILQGLVKQCDMPLDQVEQKFVEKVQKKSKVKQVLDLPSNTTNASIAPSCKGVSRFAQVKELMDQGITSASQMAKQIGTNPAYVYRLKKQVEELNKGQSE